MTSLLLRTILYTCMVIGLWIGGQFYIAITVWQQLLVPPQGAVYVDHRITDHDHYIDTIRPFFTTVQFFLLTRSMGTPQQFTGTLLLPHNTITDALVNAQTHSIKTIIVLHGTYNEHIILPDNTTLYGYDGTTVTYDQFLETDVVHMGNRSILHNIDIVGGKNGVRIPYGHSAQIRDLTIANGKDYNILMGKKKRPETPEGQQQSVTYEIIGLSDDDIAALPLFLIKDVTITGSGNQGLYLRDGRVIITDSIVIKNGEEGIDLHPHMHTMIINTHASHNGESGLETEIYDNVLIVENSVFDNNMKNGIAFITSLGTGTMTIRDSTISNNQKYGIRCAIHKNRPKTPRPFFQSMITEDNNTFFDNATHYSPECFGF